MTTDVTFDDVRDAAKRIEPYVHRTPVLTCATLDRMSGCRVFLKCENFQRVGAFKMRGATNAVSHLTAEERSRGVITHSSGNHAQALSLAAALHDTPATVVMPTNAPPVKRAATEGYGARIVPCEPTQEAREAGVEAIIRETGARLVHPYEDPRVIAGQGTAALELIDETGDLDLILTPVGGGGLLSGTTLTARAAGTTRVIGCEPEGADDAFRSLASGVRVEEQTPETVCDGLRTLLGRRPFEILRTHGVEIARVPDDRTLEALILLFERAKIVVEPSAAIGVAALLSGKVAEPGSRVGVILSGGNVDVNWLANAVARRNRD